MKGLTMKRGFMLKNAIAMLTLGAALALPTLNFGANDKPAPEPQTLKGEVVDLMCYLDHGAKGEKHKGCANKCIKSGGPVGLLTSDNQLYLVIGDHAPINDVLAPKAGEMVTLKGIVVEK